jgi:protoporphyrinogen oxidase
MIVILGAGLAGLSCAFHLGHERCLVLEKGGQPFGHIGSEQRAGFTWDQGPHVSFTQHEYVKQLFADSVKGEFDEYEVRVGNYYQGHWIDHPAQTSLHQIPEPLRSECLESFLETRRHDATDPTDVPNDYMAWLEASLGPKFAHAFPAVYTRKYWTVDASALTSSWVGHRVLKPAIQDVVAGSQGPLDKSTHYISKVRYPRSGGYQSFATKLLQGSQVRYGAVVVSIDLQGQRVHLASGESIAYQQLINTLPLPVFVQACQDVPSNVREAALALSCSQLALVNAAVPHPTMRPENWIYVYDEDKLATRINCTEMLTPGNAPPGWSGVQTEVYFSRHRPLTTPASAIADKVFSELREMGLVSPASYRKGAGSPFIHTRFLLWANVIFTHDTAPALEVIWRWLEGRGLGRQTDDTYPLTNWTASETEPARRAQPDRLFMAGRFGQWKYFWSDDCVMRGRELGLRLAA